MNHISVERLGEDQAAALHNPIEVRSTLILIAWLVTLLLSKLPLVIARDLLGIDIPWITSAWIGIAVLLFVTTYFWKALKPLRGYFLVMGVILLVAFVLDPIVKGTAMWNNLFLNASPMVILFGERILLILESLIVVSTLFLIGMSRKQAFLTVGNLRAPLGGENKSSELVGRLQHHPSA